jgi:hypothetical protein
MMIGAGVIFLLDMIYLHEKIFQSLTAGSGPAKLKKSVLLSLTAGSEFRKCFDQHWTSKKTSQMKT